MEVLALATDTRKACFTAVAAEETVRYMRQVMQAAEAGAELARRMAQVGNFNKLQQAREQGFYADAALQPGARRAGRSASTRERLTRLLGLWGAQAQFSCPSACPTCRQPPRTCPTSSAWRWRSGSTCSGAAGRRADWRRTSA